MRFFRWLFLILIVAQCAHGATTPKAAKRPAQATNQPNVILITLDTTRADRMGFLGSKRGLTPNLDALAQNSVVFTRAYSQVPLTTPSHAALLTGTYPQFNHVDDLGRPLSKDVPYLPDLLHRQGYHTAAFIGSSILDAKGGSAPGFDRGFDLYDADFHDAGAGEDRYHSFERRAGDVTDSALHWLSRHPHGPFFIWLHFYDPHDPYDPPGPFKDRYAAAPYDGEIAYVDSVVGSFMQALRQRGLYENSIIAIAADHGEAFGEHGEERHGVFLYDETVHVPLLLKLPAQKFAGRRVEERVALVEVPPTLVQSLGMTPPANMQAQSILPLVESAQPAPGENENTQDRAIYSESTYAHRVFGASELRSWRAGKYLYVQAPRRELYDSTSDPEALKNLAPSAKAVADTLDTALSDFRQKTSSAQTENAKLDPAAAQKLRALGYIVSDAASPKSSTGPIADPKDKVESANQYHRALSKIAEGKYDEAADLLRDVLKREPDAPGAYFDLGNALVDAGKYEDAEPYLRTAIEKMPESAPPHYELGLALSESGQFQAALKEMQAAVVIQPKSANLHFFVAKLRTRLQQMPEAVEEYKKTLELDPNHYQANLVYGQVLFQQGQPDASIARLTRAVKLKPDSAEAHMSLARVYGETGQTAKANREIAAAQRIVRASQH
jgi:choline-sulfatase